LSGFPTNRPSGITFEFPVVRPEVDAKHGGHFLQADFPLLIPSQDRLLPDCRLTGSYRVVARNKMSGATTPLQNASRPRAALVFLR
jgi:hypothetical protein